MSMLVGPHWRVAHSFFVHVWVSEVVRTLIYVVCALNSIVALAIPTAGGDDGINHFSEHAGQKMSEASCSLYLVFVFAFARPFTIPSALARSLCLFFDACSHALSHVSLFLSFVCLSLSPSFFLIAIISFPRRGLLLSRPPLFCCSRHCLQTFSIHML